VVRAQAPEDYKVIVNAAGPVPALSAGGMSRLFVMAFMAWPGGRPVFPIDRTVGSPTRVRFSRAVHGESLSALASYWPQTVFSGRGVPPREERSESAVVAHVSAIPDAIGYVSAAVALPAGVRVEPLAR